MDPLINELATVAGALEQILAQYSTSASSTLFLIKAQIQSLETGLESIRRWLHLIDATSTAQALRRLNDTTAIVKASVVRLWYDLDSIRQGRIETGVGNAKTPGFAFDESRMRLHLCDLGECVFLVNFAVGAYQSFGSDEHQDHELHLAARLLRSAHAASLPQRRMIIMDNIPQSMDQYTRGFNEFTKSLIGAEEDLWRHNRVESAAATPPRPPKAVRTTSEPSQNAHPEDTSLQRIATAPTQQHIPPAELPSTPLARGRETSVVSDAGAQASASRRSSSSSLLTTDSRWKFSIDTAEGEGTLMTLPASPRSTTSTENPWQPPKPSPKPVTRKPVGVPARVPSTTSMSSRQTLSMSGIRQREALLAVASASTSNQQQRYDARTSHLFREASGSLTSLADNLSSVHIEPVESPPPYHPARTAELLPTITGSDSQTSFSSSNGASKIFRAVRDNQANTLRNIIQSGVRVDVNEPLTNRTPLMEAAALRRVETVQILLDHGVRAHLKDNKGWTALHFAAIEGDVAICNLLLSAGAQLEEYNGSGETPLQLAARGGHTDAVSCLLYSWSERKGSRQTLLKAFQEACKCGNVSTAEAFIAQGVKPKSLDQAWMPLTSAAGSGSVPMLEAMLARGCSLKEKSPEGWTALHFAAQNGHLSMVEKLLSLKLPWKAQTKKTGETALHLASMLGHTSTALALVAHKDANVTIRDTDGQQPLHHAVRNGDLSLVAALLAKGARLSEVNAYGWQPIHLAAAYGHLPLVADFLTRGISMEEKLAPSSFKPRLRTNEAARRGFWAEIRWPHAACRPLHLAIEFGHDDVAKVLLASGARVEAADGHNWRPLHYAAFNCRPALIEALLENGANPHSTTDDNFTPLALGFRRSGLTAMNEDRQRVSALLQSASESTKKPKFKSLSTLMSSSSSNTKSRTAEGRNRAWHTAELAAALYQDYDVEAEAEADEGDSQFGFSENSFPLTGSDSLTQSG